MWYWERVTVLALGFDRHNRNIKVEDRSADHISLKYLFLSIQLPDRIFELLPDTAIEIRFLRGHIREQKRLTVLDLALTLVGACD